MIKRKSGGIMNVASTAAFVGGPKMALSYATKSYVLTLTEAIHDEVQEYGVKVRLLYVQVQLKHHFKVRLE